MTLSKKIRLTSIALSAITIINSWLVFWLCASLYRMKLLDPFGMYVEYADFDKDSRAFVVILTVFLIAYFRYFLYSGFKFTLNTFYLDFCNNRYADFKEFVKKNLGVDLQIRKYALIISIVVYAFSCLTNLKLYSIADIINDDHSRQMLVVYYVFVHIVRGIIMTITTFERYLSSRA